MTYGELMRRFNSTTIGQEMIPIAQYIEAMAPDCREKSLALTKLEEAMFWALAAVQRSPENKGEP